MTYELVIIENSLTLGHVTAWGAAPLSPTQPRFEHLSPAGAGTSITSLTRAQHCNHSNLPWSLELYFEDGKTSPPGHWHCPGQSRWVMFNLLFVPLWMCWEESLLLNIYGGRRRKKRWHKDNRVYNLYFTLQNFALASRMSCALREFVQMKRCAIW